MAAMYSRQQSHSKQVFNYTLPDIYPLPESCVDNSARQNQPRYAYTDPDTLSRMFINPQQLMVASPLSPDAMDYAFPTGPYPVQVAANSEEGYLHNSHSKRSARAGWSQNQNSRSYPLERSSSHRASHHNTHSYHHSNLPTPPSSPTNTIPGSANPSNPTITVHDHRNSIISTTSSNSPTTTSSTRYYCTHHSCIDPATRKSIKSFSRRADLQRHHACTHDSPALYSCPRPNCIRKGENGFTRQDHLIEHRRGYHGENIPKRGQRGRSREAKSPRRISR